MAILSSKWMIALLILIAILIILYILGNKSAHSEITINATTQEVWAVLTNTEKIGEWNTVLVPVEGELKEGNTLTYEFYQDSDKPAVMPATVQKIDEGKLINQSGGIPGILTFDHKYILEQADQGTKVTIHEEYRGIMVPFWNPGPVEEAYHRLNKALKERVETLLQKGLGGE